MNNEDPKLLCLMALKLIQANETDQAEQILQQIDSRKAKLTSIEHAMVLYTKGHISIQKDDIDAAISHFMQSLRINPDQGYAAVTWNDLGVLLVKTKNHGAAIWVYRHVIMMDHFASKASWKNIAGLLRNGFEYITFAKKNNFELGKYDSLMTKGKLLLDSGQIPLAASLFDEAARIAQDPLDAEIFTVRCLLSYPYYREKKSMKTAKKKIDKLLKKHSDNIAVLTLKLRMLLYNKDFNAVRKFSVKLHESGYKTEFLLEALQVIEDGSIEINGMDNPIRNLDGKELFIPLDASFASHTEPRGITFVRTIQQVRFGDVIRDLRLYQASNPKTVEEFLQLDLMGLDFKDSASVRITYFDYPTTNQDLILFPGDKVTIIDSV